MEPLNFRLLLARVAISTLAVKVGSVGLGFALNVLLARTLGPEQYGTYIFSLSLITILILIGTLGMENAALRFVASYVSQEAWGLLRGFVSRGLQWVTTASFLIVLFSGIGIYLVKSSLQPSLGSVLILGLPLVLISALLAFVSCCLQALNNRYIVVVQSVPLLRNILFGVLVLAWVSINSGQMEATTTMAMNLTSATLVFVFIVIFFCLNVPNQAKNTSPIFETRQWLVTMLPFLVLSGSGLIITQTDTIMVGIFLGPEQAGFYATAFRVAVLVTFGIASVNAVIAPMISRHYTQKNLRELQHIISLSAKVMFYFSLFAVIVLLVSGKMILGFFGPEFRVAYPALIILLLGQLIDSVSGSVGYLMTMTGHQREVVYVIGGCAILNIVLNIILIPYLGLVGAATATAISTILWNVILAWRVKVNIGINSTIFRFS